MWRSMSGGYVAVLASAVLITACSNESRNSTEPVAAPTSASLVPAGCPTVTQTANMIVALFPKGPDRVYAAGTYATIVLYINTGRLADARTLVFRLLNFTLQRFNAGKLIGGFSLATRQQLLAFEAGLYCTVSLPSTGLVLPGDPNDPGTVNQVVFPSTTTQNIVTPNGNAGVQIPPNSFTGTAILVTISPLTGTPLNTTLDQYGPFSDVKVTPETALIANVTVGICASAPVVPSTVFLAHNVTQTVNGVPTPGIEVLPAGATISGLCGITTGSISGRKVFDLAANGDVRSATKMLGSALADMLLPTNANATGGGITGTTKAFSPFGGVDTKVYMTANSPTTQTAPAGSAVASPPSTLVKTQLGAAVAKVNVLFSVTSGGGTVAGGSTSTVTTTGTGVATVSDWVINAGSNTLLTTGTFTDPTVTFAPSTVVGFPQAVTVATDPPAGITFTATGGDVIPYGSSYLYTSGEQGFEPNFGTTDLTTTGFAKGPFGTGDQGTTVCAINSDANFPPNHQWPLGTDLLLLKTFPLPQGWSAPLTVSAAIDNDIQVFVNGHPLTFDPAQPEVPLFTFSGNDAANYSFDSGTGFVKHENCATKGSLTFSIPAAFLNLGGQNTLAIRARDRGTVNYVDAKISVPTPQ